MSEVLELEDPAPTGTGRTALPIRWVVAASVAYAVLAVVGRLTVVHGQTVSLVWPGAGAAVIWLLVETPRLWWRVLLLVLVIHATVSAMTGADWQLVVLGAVSLVVQTAVVVWLVRRWCPSLLGAGGTQSFRSPRLLAQVSAAAAIGCLVGAAIGTAGVAASGSPVDAWTPVAWFARHFTGVIVFGGLGHLAWEWRTQSVPPRAQGGSRLELALLWAISLAASSLVFLQPLPLVFLVVALSVWSAARYPTFLAALHAAAVGSVGFVLTLAGFGPFAELADPVEQALLIQVFLVAVLLTGLGVGALGDRIDELVASLTRSREQAAEQAELLAEMTESMGEGLVVLDEVGRVVRSNGASRRLAHRVAPGADDDTALHDLVVQVLHPVVDTAAVPRPELGVGDVPIRLADGDELVLAVSRAPLSEQHGDGRAGTLLVLREVTEHRKGLRPLAGFASTAAHDLRGPLTAIRSWISLAAETLDPDDEAHEGLQRAERASLQMADMIDDLLAHALAEAGDLAPVDVPLSGADGVLAQAGDLLGPDDELVIATDLPAVHADPVAVRQLFANLIGNGAKYTRDGVPARVVVSARRQGARVVVEVEDNGVGVEESERTLIFQRFHRSGAVRAHFRGTGMGLSICQTVVQRHGGTIECLAADPGPGSVFRFDLPAAIAETADVPVA
ncbi:MASE1 domain-containing protein [Nocardioides sp. J2M5]|uniref:ATP-binding protein n=1 Tax=Nocardioides palaemonis TaxID=2829810 RepID=UPI001BA83F8B|nr:ATP-binding protein [Nocardioides palaemonis]MBS2939749.1 MASE1 domain-containing protein [Nocardioides palaemonis]